MSNKNKAQEILTARANSYGCFAANVKAYNKYKDMFGCNFGVLESYKPKFVPENMRKVKERDYDLVRSITALKLARLQFSNKPDAVADCLYDYFNYLFLFAKDCFDSVSKEESNGLYIEFYSSLIKPLPLREARAAVVIGSLKGRKFTSFDLNSLLQLADKLLEPTKCSY